MENQEKYRPLPYYLFTVTQDFSYLISEPELGRSRLRIIAPQATWPQATWPQARHQRL